MKNRTVWMIISLLLWGSCTSPDRSDPDTTPGPDSSQPAAEAFSLFGDALYAPILPDSLIEIRQALLDSVRSIVEADPTNADAHIWWGRRTAYLGNYQEAIRVFSEGISKHPDDARFYRHRGHRYITTRQFDKAIPDFEKAAALIEGTEDQVEPDGLPNALGIPTSTLHGNVWYHLGLSYYVTGNFDNARDAYLQCLDLSTNPDMDVATRHWLYMTYRRLGDERAAAAVIRPIGEGLDIIENQAYYSLLLFYKGLRQEKALLSADTEALNNTTIAYGIANWHFYNGRTEEAERILERIVADDQWAAFGHIAAEVDLYNMRQSMDH